MTAAADPLQRLRDERAQIDELFNNFERHRREPGYPDADAARLSAWICTLLRVHDELESSVLQPALTSAGAERPPLEQSARRRAAVRDAMDRIEALPPGDPRHGAEMSRLACDARDWFDCDETVFELADRLPLDRGALDARLGARQEDLLSV